MAKSKPSVDSAADDVARRIIDQTGGRIRLALPLGLGKANGIVNALTRAACADPQISLTILTALTLQRPAAKAGLKRRFLEPAADRLFGRYEPILYAQMIEEGTLPANIQVREFFFQAGYWLGNAYAQRHYISANYTHALTYALDFQPNVVAQLLARDDDGRTSLSCNTDITVDLLAARRQGRAEFIFAAEINENLPFMGGPAVVGDGEVDIMLEPDTSFELFSAVRQPVSLQHIAIGLQVSQLVPDGGTLQIGIGSIGDAIAQALLLREHKNEDYLSLFDACPFPDGAPEQHRARFEEGLYSVTEMLVGGLLELFESGIIRREVDGAAIHAAFFLECRDFYRRLREMPVATRDRIAMMPVSFTNSLYGDEEKKRAARRDARFVNNAMIVTCLGAAVSDGTGDGQVVSGVGGQFNFVSQALELEGGRSIITLNATRESNGKTVSNIRWNYPHMTVPRHYRDIVVTEYGVADLRAKTDEQCIAAMLDIADSRFQQGLLEQAKRAGNRPGLRNQRRPAPEYGGPAELLAGPRPPQGPPAALSLRHRLHGSRTASSAGIVCPETGGQIENRPGAARGKGIDVRAGRGRLPGKARA
ncbi:acetyl-CoA hydrolase/transferase C-terminal domain-containing protein [Roseibium salinum]|uniref:acetyl-CoA hydrolase/transferase C-terminal domain-containing protein n=1 Tax=Roseibium salinum TaxID=1604349 RepID=UPI0036161A8F